MLDRLCVCILVYNEEIHLRRCLDSVRRLTTNVLLVDSGSTDATERIAKDYGYNLCYNSFVNYGKQRMYAIEHAFSIGYEWMFFVDADEYLTPELIQEMLELDGEGVSGYIVKRRFIWRGTWIKHGGYYPTKLLRLFRLSDAQVTREINEHIEVKGSVKVLTHDLIDENMNSIEFWLDKHNRYSSMEARSWFDNHEGVNRQLLTLRSFPLLLQPFIYFLYRVIIRGGFRDGMNAVWYHYLHAFVMFGVTAYKYKEIANVRISRIRK